MEISIYTDAARNQDTGVAGVGYLIHTEDCYVDMDSVPVEAMSSLEAESTAVFQGIVNLFDRVNLVSTDKVTIYTDNMKLVRMLKGLDKVTGKNRKVFYRTINMYQKLCSMCIVQVSWVRGHDKGCSQNKLVDRLAKYAIRYEQLASQN